MSEASRAPGRRPNQGRVGTTVNGKWHIDARIGSGGMATVYAATHRNGRRAALKMLHATLSRDEATRARFLREGYVANAVGHPNVVHVEDDGISDDGAAYLVLDLLEGDTIEARRTQVGGALPVDEVLDMADQALDALAAAHEKGIIHRDVKPDNVFLCHDGRAMLLDFGLAQMKSSESEATKTGVTIGTPAFMPPEQAQGRREEVDAQSDVWGLGATIFTSITGQYVHDAETLHEQLIANATIRPRSVRELMPHVSPSVAVVIDRALELEKVDRWESAREMQRALRAARAPRTDSDRFLMESLTLPAASLRHGAHASQGKQAPPSGPRPSSGSLDLAVPSSDPTMRLPPPPSSDQTVELSPRVVQPIPVAADTEHMILEGLPSSGGPMSPPPTTERLEGAHSGAVLQAQSQRTQLQAQALVELNLGRTGPRTPQLLHLQQQMQHQMRQAPPPPPQDPLRTHQSPSPSLSSSGSGPYAVISSGSVNSSEPGIALRGSGSLLPEAQSHAMVPYAHANNPSSAVHSNSHYPNSLPAPSLPPLPPLPPPSASPPVSLRSRRSSSAVIFVSVVLILLCGAMGAWVLLHR